MVIAVSHDTAINVRFEKASKNFLFDIYVLEIKFCFPVLYFVLIKQYFVEKRKLCGIEFVKLDWEEHSRDMC